jgi:hypothetical protein
MAKILFDKSCGKTFNGGDFEMTIASSLPMSRQEDGWEIF